MEHMFSNEGFPTRRDWTTPHPPTRWDPAKLPETTVNYRDIENFRPHNRAGTDPKPPFESPISRDDNMTFTQLKNQVDALCRKYATELAIYRARPLALEFCDEMAEAVTPGKPKSTMQCTGWARMLFERLRERGIRVKTHIFLSEYLEGCLERLILPQVNNILRALFLEARERGLIPRSREQVPFTRRRVWKPGTSYFIAALSDAAQAADARARPCRI